jgi:ABC-type multidrug transport system fused ATPase/permease subunit
MQASQTANGAFAQLGTGSEQDTLSFRLIVEIFWRTLPLITTVKRHLLFFLGATVLGVILGFPATLLVFDALWNGVLAGDPINYYTAVFYAFDPAIYAGTGPVPEAARTLLRDRFIIYGFIAVITMAPAAGAMMYYLVWILQRINQILRVRLLDRFQALSLRFHADSRVGDSIYRIYQDSAMVTNVIETLFLQPAMFVLRFCVGIAVVFFFNWVLALIMLLALPPAIGVGYWFSTRLRTRFRRAREANSDVTSRIQETISGIKVIKAYGAEKEEQARFERDSQHAFDVTFTARNFYAVFGVLMFWIAGTALLAVVTWSAAHTLWGSDLFGAGLLNTLGLGTLAFGFTAWSLGLFNSFKTFSGYSSFSIEGMFSLWGRAQDIAIGLDRVFELLDMKPEVEDAPNAIPLAPLHDEIRYEGVSFAYQPDRPVLHEVDLAARPGTITAIVGPTGSGKSTLMALLLRLFDPNEGRITIDGIDLKQLQLDSLRANIAIALQENILFGTTVRENIRYAVPNASDEQVRAAARVASATEFIEALPQGYDTPLGERGTKLSSGQRQRLSIARAILKNTPILVLDEPTAALDAETEMRVLRNLAEWGRGRAIFLITHRLSTIRLANQIAYLRDGRIIERGSHAELMARPGGAYRTFVELEEQPARAAGGGS